MCCEISTLQVVQAFSAGILLIGVSSRTTEVMAEDGTDILIQKSKHIDEFPGVDFDYVVTLCDDATAIVPYLVAKPGSFTDLLMTHVLHQEVKKRLWRYLEKCGVI